MNESNQTRSKSDDRLHSIGEVLSVLQNDFHDVTISKIRFLEARGLVTPQRAPSGYRKFSGADVERLRMVLIMQRDHFLPLRVIKERLDDGTALSLLARPAADEQHPTEGGAQPPAHAAADALHARAAGAGGNGPSPRFRGPRSAFDDIGVDEFARLAGISTTQLEELTRFGLVDPPSDTGPGYSREELQVARAAAGFLRHGIEARHLKAWRVAAEREAGMIEQILLPLAHQQGDEAKNNACEVADELIEMGDRIREGIIVKSLRDRLGLEST